MSMTPEAESLQAQLRQIEEFRSKGLLRADQADAQRAALLRRLMHLVVPDTPAPRLPWRVHLGALGAMGVLVGGVTAYLLSANAGLRRHTIEYLAMSRQVAAQDDAARRERLARIAAGESLAPDQFGRFTDPASAPQATASAALAGPPASGAADDAVAPLLSGRVELDPAWADRVRPDDALFVTVRSQDDPTGLPLAQIRVEAGNLPLDFDIGARQLLGSPQRFMQARAVVVSARVSRAGSGLAQPGDLVGQSDPVAPWSGHVRLVIGHAVRR